MNLFESFIGDQRWMEVINTLSETVPAFAVVRPTGVNSDGLFQIAKPNSDSAKLLFIVGPTAIGAANAATERGLATYDFPTWALYDTADGTPAVGEQWGTETNSFKLHSGKTGFLIVGAANTTEGRVLVVQEVCRSE